MFGSDVRFCPNDGTSLGPLGQTADGDALLGQTVDGRYVVERVLGRGGMGVVYAARQQPLDRIVALKILGIDLASVPDAQARFLHEAKIVSQLRHPNTVHVHDFGRLADGRLYISMEFLDGEPLSTLLRAGPLAPRRTLGMIDQICKSLAEAHAAGIIHRDLKPENLILDQVHGAGDFVRVLDFGIARLHAETTRLTRTGTLVGTPQYMAPEQWRDDALDGRTDIYALGGVLYEMLVGAPPFRASTVPSLMFKHINELPTAPSKRTPPVAVDPRLDALLLDMLAKDPSNRPASMDVLRARIGQMVPVLADSGQGGQDQTELGAGTPFSRGHVDRAGEVGSAPGHVEGARNHGSRRQTAAIFAIATSMAALGVFLWFAFSGPSSESIEAGPSAAVAARSEIAAVIDASASADPLGPDGARQNPAGAPVVDKAPERSSSQAAKRKTSKRPQAKRRYPALTPPSPRSEPNPRPRQTRLQRIVSAPPGALVLRGKQPLGRTPLNIKVKEPMRLVIRKRNYYDQTIWVRPGRPAPTVELDKEIGLDDL